MLTDEIRYVGEFVNLPSSSRLTVIIIIKQRPNTELCRCHLLHSRTLLQQSSCILNIIIMTFHQIMLILVDIPLWKIPFEAILILYYTTTILFFIKCSKKLIHLTCKNPAYRRDPNSLRRISASLQACPGPTYMTPTLWVSYGGILSKFLIARSIARL